MTPATPQEQTDGHTKGLIERLEAAEVGSRVLDALVTVALRLDCERNLPDDLQYLSAIRRDDECAAGTYWYICRSGRSLRKSEPVTTSLDAALSLAERVLPGWFVGVQQNRGGVPPWSALLSAPDSWCDDVERDAKTPALALCIAILRAKEQAS